MHGRRAETVSLAGYAAEAGRAAAMPTDATRIVIHDAASCVYGTFQRRRCKARGAVHNCMST